MDDLEPVRTAIRALGARARGEIWQTDTYFRTGPGTRLKLREQRPGPAELIAYARSDLPGLRESVYRRWPVRDAAGLAAALELALGVRVRVHKWRHLHLLGRTRVHLDAVGGLGLFVELEVALGRGEGPARGRREAESLLRRLDLATAPRIARSYADLVRRRRISRGAPRGTSRT